MQRLMVGNSYKFTWTGHLNAKEIKFSCDRKTDWNGAFFLATSGGANPVEELTRAEARSKCCTAMWAQTPIINGVLPKPVPIL